MHEKWRNDNPGKLIDLSGADPSDAGLYAVDLHDANLVGANLRGALVSPATSTWPLRSARTAAIADTADLGPLLPGRSLMSACQLSTGLVAHQSERASHPPVGNTLRRKAVSPIQSERLTNATAAPAHVSPRTSRLAAGSARTDP
ncbi:pentapeptide repeat-containing protein [Nocardia sp. NPDC051832]|uniref:pentapeptide repeat-containing protein n=1 Tax=Nocardia sp. NPDC051832 TaxID=3155673 RepID=UPI0034416345